MSLRGFAGIAFAFALIGGSYIVMRDTPDLNALSQPAASASVTIRTVSPQEFRDQIAADHSTQVIDVRTPAEYASGHIAGAQNIDFNAPDFLSRIRDLDPSARYAIYCRSGNRSGKALDMMRNEGFADVINLGGGVQAWSDASLPLVQH